MSVANKSGVVAGIQGYNQDGILPMTIPQPSGPPNQLTTVVLHQNTPEEPLPPYYVISKTVLQENTFVLKK